MSNRKMISTFHYFAVFLQCPLKFLQDLFEAFPSGLMLTVPLVLFPFSQVFQGSLEGDLHESEYRFQAFHNNDKNRLLMA